MAQVFAEASAHRYPIVAMLLKWPFPYGLYPTIALSDACIVVAVAAAALHALYGVSPAQTNAAAGCCIVGLAAGFGVLRFGVNESEFGQVHNYFSQLAGFVGLPMVGFCFFPVQSDAGIDALMSLLPKLPTLSAADFVLILALLSVVAKRLPPKVYSMTEVVINLFLFVLPVASRAYLKGDRLTLSAVGIFMFASLVIGPDRYAYILGMRRINWFHYLIAIAVYLITLGL